MSELSCDGQESKTVLHCHENPQQYHSCQSSQDILTSVISNEYTLRTLHQQLDDLVSKSEGLAENAPRGDDDGFLYANYLLEMSRVGTELVRITNRLANVYKERVAQNPELYKAISRLTTDEFSRIYASSGRGELAHDHNYHGNCFDNDDGHNYQRCLGFKQLDRSRDCPTDSPCVYDRLFELSATTDETNGLLVQTPQSHYMAEFSEAVNDAPAKPRKSVWKRILKPSARERGFL